MPSLSADDMHRLAPYVTNIDSDVFALKNLPEEVVAFLFARYSRSPLSLKEDLLQMLRDEHLDSLVSVQEPVHSAGLEAIQSRARTFAEKYVAGYGHASVAEHAVVKLALENVSILASKIIEDCRLASYTEKSTRYVAFDPTKAHYPPEFEGTAVSQVYRKIVADLMGAYAGWMPLFIDQIKQRVQKTEKQSDRGYDAACRSTACDLLRYLLPTATHTNIGLTINARSLENMITKLLSQPLPEGQELGHAIKSEASLLTPTLIKYAGPNDYRAHWSRAQPSRVTDAGDPMSNFAQITGTHFSEEEALGMIALPERSEQLDLDALFEGRTRHDPAPRALERVSLTFDLIMDYGAYRDIQRHRLASQTAESLSPRYGYEIPVEFVRFGYETQYKELMERAAGAYAELLESGYSAQAPYALPLAYRIRILFTANLRELFHFIELRSGRQGHPSYRRIAQQMYLEVKRVYPRIATFIRVNSNEYALTRD